MYVFYFPQEKSCYSDFRYLNEFPVHAELTELHSSPIVKIYHEDQPTKIIYLAFSTVNRLLELESKIVRIMCGSILPTEIQSTYESFVKKAAADTDFILSKEINKMIGNEEKICMQTIVYFGDLFEWDVEFEKENMTLASLEM